MALPGIVALTDMLAVLPRQIFDDTRWKSQLGIIEPAQTIPAPMVSIVRRADLPLTPAASELLGWIRHFASQPECA